MTFLQIVFCKSEATWCLTQLSTMFSYIVEVSFIGGGNRGTKRKPSTWRRSL